MELQEGQAYFGNNMDSNGIRTIYAEGISVIDNRKIKGSLLQVNGTTFIYEGFMLDLKSKITDKLILVNSSTVQIIVEVKNG